MILTHVTAKDDKTPSTPLLPALEHQCRSFSMAELSSATDNFDEKWCIGQGGFGKVYKGMFSDDSTSIYAIKRLDFMSNQGATEFWVEVVGSPMIEWQQKLTTQMDYKENPYCHKQENQIEYA